MASKLNYDGGGCGIPAKGEMGATKKVANVSGTPAKMGSASNMGSVGNPKGGSTVPASGDSKYSSNTNNPDQKEYYSHDGRQDVVDAAKFDPMPKDFYSLRKGR